MAIVRVSQRDDTDCLMSWFEGRKYDEARDMFAVLSAHGYTVEEFKETGEVHGVRRIVGMINGIDEDGHSVAMDDDESIVDPKSKATDKKYLHTYANSGYHVHRVFVIREST
jgi:hypothetical protein